MPPPPLPLPVREELLLLAEEGTSVLSRLADNRLGENLSYLFANAEADAGAAPFAEADT